MGTPKQQRKYGRIVKLEPYKFSWKEKISYDFLRAASSEKVQKKGLFYYFFTPDENLDISALDATGTFDKNWNALSEYSFSPKEWSNILYRIATFLERGGRSIKSGNVLISLKRISGYGRARPSTVSQSSMLGICLNRSMPVRN